MIILKMCFSVNQIDDLQNSNKKLSWTFRLPWSKLKILNFSQRADITVALLTFSDF